MCSRTDLDGSESGFAGERLGRDEPGNDQKGANVIVLGLVLMLIGFLAHIPILWSLGILVAIVGLVLLLLGAAGREVGGRRHYY